MTLGQQQRRFAPLVAKLIQFAYKSGYEITFGEAYRTPEQAQWNAEHGAGISNSLHIIRLAIDINLFRDGVYLKDTAAYKPLGDYWRTLDPDCRWGGNFTSLKDPYHFSLTWNGVQ